MRIITHSAQTWCCGNPVPAFGVATLTCIGHAQKPWLIVFPLEALIRKAWPKDRFPPRAIPLCEIAALRHESGDDAVEGAPLEVQPLAALQQANVRYKFGRRFRRYLANGPQVQDMTKVLVARCERLPNRNTFQVSQVYTRAQPNTCLTASSRKGFCRMLVYHGRAMSLEVMHRKGLSMKLQPRDKCISEDTQQGRRVL